MRAKKRTSGRAVSCYMCCSKGAFPSCEMAMRQLLERVLCRYALLESQSNQSACCLGSVLPQSTNTCILLPRRLCLGASCRQTILCLLRCESMIHAFHIGRRKALKQNGFNQLSIVFETTFCSAHLHPGSRRKYL